ncbi:YbgA family protein [Halalkalibacter urbisdiaboli]|uniref:YbgA family protein n=1 Tax=Halalkalibacter urbisdiaboli TaxID=1960589 RepID=UPI000B43E297|nr:DUF523 and DUF1722 domain-containing protein [Halalkalibacter urbisdiaboli]
MRTFIKPKIVVSKCLEFSACRYNGDKINDDIIANLQPFVYFIPVCPEVEIGLGTPRDVIRLVANGEESRLVQPKTGHDLTESMTEFSNEFLGSLDDIDGFILKGRSPSCGISDAKVYSGLEKAPVVRTESGVFTKAIKNSYPNILLEDEGRLKNFIIREHYFTYLFTIAEFRELKEKNKTIAALMQFQARNKYLFMAMHLDKMRNMGKIVANHEKKSLEDVFTQYEEELILLFAKPPNADAHINVCQHVFGYFSKQLTLPEKEHFHSMLERFQQRKSPLSSVLSILRSWCYRFDNQYLLRQTYFEPYPEELIAISDSGKGRNLS